MMQSRATGVLKPAAFRSLTTLIYPLIATIYLHRNFFVRAMMDHPQDPMRSKYAASYVAASRSASDIIKITVCMLMFVPSLVMTRPYTE
jgi:hypothetical protein